VNTNLLTYLVTYLLAIIITAIVKALAVASGGSADDVSDGLNRRDLDVALRQWVEVNSDSLTAAGPGNVDQLEKVGRLMMNIGSRLEAGDSAENDQMALKRRVEAVWKLRRVCYYSNNENLYSPGKHGRQQ